jgi:hypothetical protein
MREARNSRPAEDSVNPSCMKPVSAEQIRAVAKFLPIFENIKPDDFSHSVRLPGQEDVCYGVGFVEFHPAVNAFIEACYACSSAQMRTLDREVSKRTDLRL